MTETDKKQYTATDGQPSREIMTPAGYLSHECQDSDGHWYPSPYVHPADLAKDRAAQDAALAEWQEQEWVALTDTEEWNARTGAIRRASDHEILAWDKGVVARYALLTYRKGMEVGQQAHDTTAAELAGLRAAIAECGIWHRNDVPYPYNADWQRIRALAGVKP